MDRLQQQFSPGSSTAMNIAVSALKYLLEGLAVALAVYIIPRRVPTVMEIVKIAVTAAAVFAILDLWAPMVGVGSRQGAGFGLGAKVVGFGGVPVPPPGL